MKTVNLLPVVCATLLLVCGGPLLIWLGLGLTGISFVAAPLAAIWYALSLWLGRKQVAMARARE